MVVDKAFKSSFNLLVSKMMRPIEYRNFRSQLLTDAKMCCFPCYSFAEVNKPGSLSCYCLFFTCSGRYLMKVYASGKIKTNLNSGVDLCFEIDGGHEIKVNKAWQSIIQFFLVDTPF